MAPSTTSQQHQQEEDDAPSVTTTGKREEQFLGFPVSSWQNAAIAAIAIVTGIVGIKVLVPPEWFPQNMNIPQFNQQQQQQQNNRPQLIRRPQSLETPSEELVEEVPPILGNETVENPDEDIIPESDMDEGSAKFRATREPVARRTRTQEGFEVTMSPDAAANQRYRGTKHTYGTGYGDNHVGVIDDAS